MHLRGLLAAVSLLIGLSSAIVIPHSSTPFVPADHFLNATKRQGSHLPYGLIITHCNVPNTVALTFDDGPFIYTGQMLDTLTKHNARATFFLNGVNKGNIDSFPELVRRTLAEGHQLGSHTWGHLSLDTLSYNEIITQMTDLEDAFMRILGFFPTYMRAPYLMVTADVLNAMTELKYHVIGASIDTKDYENDHPDDSWRSFEKFRAELDAGGTIVLAHDTHQTTVEILLDNMLTEIALRGHETVTVGECLADPPEYWYRTSR
ncbi:Glycoside hydrolase/deacetylase beta/alpha-barrel [Penicillium longicatenatum]|nr:Glycoside hydrolase/deacetylase beta/alpha-barrel [Penicillium longicatenatum]